MNATPLDTILFNQLHYTPEQLFDLYGQLRTHFAGAPVVTGDPTLRQVAKHFAKACDDLGRCLGRAGTKGSGDLIQAADEERDNLWMGLNGEIEAKLRLTDPNRRAAAERLHQLISDRFDRSLHRLSLEENSAALDQFFVTLDGSKESQGDLALLGLAIDWYVPLKAAHARFKKEVAAASALAAGREDLPLTRQTCARAARKLRLLIDLCEDHAEENHGDHIALHRAIAEIIGTVRTKAKAVGTRARNKKSAVTGKPGGLAS